MTPKGVMMLKEHSISNSKKSSEGNKNKDKIETLCRRLKEQGLILGYKRYPKQGEDFCHVDEGKSFLIPQYHPHFILTDNRGGKILLFTSSSFRSDRFKATLWDSEGLSKHSKISNEIVATIFVTKDSEDLEQFNAFRKKSEGMYSSIQYLFTESEFLEFAKTLEITLSQKKEEDEETNSWFKNFDTSGSGNGRRGNRFVSYLCEQINSSTFLDSYSKGIYRSGKLHEKILDDVFTTCLKDFGIGISSIRSVSSNTHIEYSRKGNPKTDISVTAILKDGTKRRDTFSSKVTKDTKVSVNDYPVDTYIEVLSRGDEDSVLARGLRLFQAAGSWERTNFPSLQFKAEFFKELGKKMGVLYDWCVSGLTLGCTPEDECVAKNIILVNYLSSKFKIYSVGEYKDILYQRKNNSCTPTYPFSFTYPSKKRGIRIQLKIPVIVD